MKFTFLGVPVRICPSFWLFLLVFTGIYQHFSCHSFILAGVIFVSLLVHEYGHALMAARFGVAPHIILEALGGKALYNPQGLTLKQHFFIALSGPLMESLLIVIPYFCLKMGVFESGSYIHYALYVTMKMNLFWCLLNALPVLPLDGGQMLLCLLQMKFGEKGAKVTYSIGALLACAGSIYFLQKEMFFFGIMLGMFAIQNYQAIRAVRKIPKNFYSIYQMGAQAAKEGDRERAKEIFKKLLKGKDAGVKLLATEALAGLYAEENADDKSYSLLLTEEERLREGKYLLCKLAFQKGNYALVAKHAEASYRVFSTYETAVMNSKAFAHLGDAYYAGAWLKTASLFGPEEEKKVKDLITDSVYDLVREKETFQKEVEGICSFEKISS